MFLRAPACGSQILIIVPFDYAEDKPEPRVWRLLASNDGPGEVGVFFCAHLGVDSGPDST